MLPPQSITYLSGSFFPYSFSHRLVTDLALSYSKSKLRQKEAPALGPKYSGVRVSRAALDDSSDDEPDVEDDEDSEDGSGNESEEYDDPETADLERDNIIDDEEIESDNALSAGEEEMFRKKGFTFKDSKTVKNNGRPKRPVAADFMSGSETDSEAAGSEDEDASGMSEEEEESDAEGSSEDDDGSEEGSDEEDGSSEDDEMDDSGADQGDSHSDLRKLMKTDQKAVVATISQAAKEDAQKGVAVRQQRRAYDSLLNLRIRLQKGLVAINSLAEATDADENEEGQQTPYQAAEQAALKLWTAIDGFRASLLPEPSHKTGTKRKRDFDTDASSEQIWAAMQETEEHASAKRKKVLDKWSARVKSTTATVGKERQLSSSSSAATQSIVAVLESQLLTSTERLVGRTRVPRSCAPVQAARKVAEDAAVFDDADFYQLLLKELVDQRSADAGGAGAEGGSGSVPTVRWTAIREAKTRKQVDRRASKGRKLRFTVHEKLQNFMAPEDRRAWEEDAIDRLFGTLFGQRIGLKEDVEEEDADEMDIAEEGLKLFRS